MTKAELIEKLHGDLEMDLSKKALGEIVDGLFETMSHAIKDDERFSYPGFTVHSLFVPAKRVRAAILRLVQRSPSLNLQLSDSSLRRTSGSDFLSCSKISNKKAAQSGLFHFRNRHL